ncbi:MAG: cytochrome P450 [Rhodospirillaceae bacterium]|nr:MAG: cytochrome P450 [Rhodospirillaceae bacterium]
MQSVTDLALPHLPIEEPAFAADPMPYIEAARRQHPWLAKCNGGYVVHGYQAIKDLLYMDDRLSASSDDIIEIMGAKGTRWGKFIQEMVLAKSGPEHARLRGSIAAAFTPRNVNRYRPLMQEVVSRLLDEWAPKGTFNFAEFASYFPITVLCRIIGASPAAIPNLRHALETLGLAYSMDRSLMPELEAAYNQAWGFADQLVIERQTRGSSGEDLLDVMIAAKAAGQLNEQELRDMLVFLFVAGFDTSKNALTLIMHSMLRHPEHWVRCAEDQVFCDKVVEEQFRHTATTSIPRTLAEDVSYGDIRFPTGSMLIFAVPMSGRDPTAFSDPMMFQPERISANRHMAFGRGMHMCLGQHLARAQIGEGVHLMAQRITKPRLVGEVTWRRFPGVWGISSLPIAFEPNAHLKASAVHANS